MAKSSKLTKIGKRLRDAAADDDDELTAEKAHYKGQPKHHESRRRCIMERLLDGDDFEIRASNLTGLVTLSKNGAVVAELDFAYGQEDLSAVDHMRLAGGPWQDFDLAALAKHLAQATE